MMRKLLVSVLLASAPASAMAADAGLPMDEPPTGYNWTGGYVGAQLGYAWGDSHYSNELGDFADYDPDGVFGGVYVGYNHQLSNIVLGVDADFAWTGMGQQEPYFLGGNLNPSYFVDSDAAWIGAVRARLGYALDRWMPYVAGGVSAAEYRFSLNYRGGDGDVTFFDEKQTLTGWNIGAGLEYAATDNLILRGEYRYTNYGSKNIGPLFLGEGDALSSIDLKTHDIRVGIAYKF